MELAKVSVCMITYNHAKYINKAIQGVLKQKVNFPMELIIADDCSTDETLEIVQDEISKNTTGVKIELIKNERNVGVNRNFINALYACDGNYIAICEGDDYWGDNSKIQIQYDFLESNPSFVMSFHVAETKFTDGRKGYQIPNVTTKKNLSFSDLLSGYYTIPNLTTFLRNTIKGKLPDQFYQITNCDTFLFLLLTQHGDAYFHSNIEKATHLLHEGGIWGMKNEYEKSMKSYRTYSKIYEYFKDQRLIVTKSNFANSIIISALKKGEYGIALKYYLKNIYHSFVSREARIGFILKQKNYFK
ncbi:glycosyltransferase [Lunatibacter salilacus]|uniref:glycosyltransferase n=1 Tax=Lunatibacter salilacus TaxID=2483804 RepID=UPI00131CA3DC|nr:glycosyltransferase [Lunatibacter salilacus]